MWETKVMSCEPSAAAVEPVGEVVPVSLALVLEVEDVPELRIEDVLLVVRGLAAEPLSHGPPVDDPVVARLLQEQRELQARLPEQIPVPNRRLEEEPRRHLVQAERVVADELEVLRIAGEQLGRERYRDLAVLVEDTAEADLKLVLRREVD